MRKKSPAVDATDPVDDRLLSAAVEVFMEKGFAAASIDEIAAKAKASKLTFYNRYGNKEGLFEAVVRRKNARLLDILGGTIPIGMPLEEFLQTVANRLHVALLQKETVALVRVLHAEAERFPKLADIFDKAGPAKATELLAAEFMKRMALGTLRKADPALVAEHFLHLALGELTRRILLGVRPSLTRAETARRITAGIDVFLRAYATK